MSTATENAELKRPLIWKQGGELRRNQDFMERLKIAPLFVRIKCLRLIFAFGIFYDMRYSPEGVSSKLVSTL